MTLNMASTGVIEITEDSQFNTELTNAGSKLVLVDFFAVWCGPCTRIAPDFQRLSLKYPNVVFLKVNVDTCKETATSQGITAMPTFIFFKNKVKIDTVQRVDPSGLEEAIKKWISGDGGDEESSPVKGHMDLGAFISKSGCECLNESDDHPLAHALTTKGGYLESDCDEQLIITIQFNQAVKLHSLRIQGPEDYGPKTIKLFQNLPRSLDFDSAESFEATQMFELTADDVKEGSLIPVRYVKFQNVSNITLFVKDNLGGMETTQIEYLGFVGSAVGTTNMADFKRVAGKKGESH